VWKFWGIVGLVLAQDTLPRAWKYEGLLSTQASQTALSNWRAGGQNQIGGAIQGNATLTYTRQRTKLKATLSTQYGLLQVVPQRTFRKTQDLLLLILKYRRSLHDRDRWALVGLLDGRTQWAPSYKYIGDSVVRPAESAFLAPLYVQFSGGLSYKPLSGWQMGLFPASGRVTYVRLSYLAEAGAFGLRPAPRDENGQILSPARKTLWEVGARFTSNLELTLFKTLTVKHFLDVFGSYSHNPWGPVVFSQFQAAYKLKSWLALTFSQQLIYDPRIASGPEALQLLTTWGLGLTYQTP